MECFICKSRANIQFRDDQHYVVCPVCGKYQITDSAVTDSSLKGNKLHLLSGVLRGLSDQHKTIVLSNSNISNLIISATSPNNPLEAIDTLLLDILRRSESIEKPISYLATDFSILFCKGATEFFHIIELAKELKFLEAVGDRHNVRLSIGGWRRLQELRTIGSVKSKTAFMAMRYGNINHDAVFTNHFKPAVAGAGFHLEKLSEVLQAGTIDNQLRTEIRTCRFLLADLTGGNSGAYWEAGFAEGLGKPVIYLCERNYFKKYKTHFDTNHQTTVLWSSHSIESDMIVLKATIRSTLPGEADLLDNVSKRGEF